MERTSRLRAASAALAGALVVLAPAAHAGTLMCKGELIFADSIARAATLFVDTDNGQVYTPSCFKYPELVGFCQGHVRGANNHQFMFGAAFSEENAKMRIELYPTSLAVRASTDTALLERPKTLFLGRCEPARISARGRRRS